MWQPTGRTRSREARYCPDEPRDADACQQVGDWVVPHVADGVATEAIAGLRCRAHIRQRFWRSGAAAIEGTAHRGPAPAVPEPLVPGARADRVHLSYSVLVLHVPDPGCSVAAAHGSEMHRHEHETGAALRGSVRPYAANRPVPLPVPLQRKRKSRSRTAIVPDRGPADGPSRWHCAAGRQPRTVGTDCIGLRLRER